jgi:hypothetical protein
VKAKPAKLSVIITLIGAGIVLATFVVKDVMNERLKDINDSLGSAEAFYLTQTYNLFVQDDLSYVKQEVDETKVAIGSNNQPGIDTKRQIIAVRAQASDDHVNVVIEYIRNLAQLIAKLPQEQNKSEQVKALLEQSSQDSAQIKALQAEVDPLFSAIRQNPNDPKAIGQLEDFVAKTGKISNDTNSMMAKTTALTGAVVLDLRERKMGSERNYEITTIFSYILFGLGWITSLAGQLLGVGDSSVS